MVLTSTAPGLRYATALFPLPLMPVRRPFGSVASDASGCAQGGVCYRQGLPATLRVGTFPNGGATAPGRRETLCAAARRPSSLRRAGMPLGCALMTTNSQATPSFAVHIPDAELEPEPLDPAQIVSGDPAVTGKVLWESADGKQLRGIWQITPGVVTDTEANELFVVVSGRATIEVEGGDVIEVGPGDAAVLREGDRTTWTVHETLRKAYHISL